ncbi:hypothetical protein BDY24DRAFT_400874 [Mrakia frigida]|uniref:uncharacterized protein n=1 Tax=Mrakia frigida TaxID=29902 RepID=UPI003FCC0E51
MDLDFTSLLTSLHTYLSSLRSFLLAHFGPSSPPFLTQLESLPSTLLRSFQSFLTGDPTTFFLYITLPILMFSAFRSRGKELDRLEGVERKKVSSESFQMPSIFLSSRKLTFSIYPFFSSSSLGQMEAELADAETLAAIKRAADAQVEEDRPFVSTKGKEGKGAGRGNAPVKRN